tara:strand:+ start:217 stop:507 length:291 start_codon:yes stop_codon:yes gene_type:complete
MSPDLAEFITALNLIITSKKEGLTDKKKLEAIKILMGEGINLDPGFAASIAISDALDPDLAAASEAYLVRQRSTPSPSAGKKRKRKTKKRRPTKRR